MNKTAICTISTQSHIFKSKVMLKSAREHTNADLFCLISEGGNLPVAIAGETYHQLDILSTVIAQKIKSKYTGNKLRWSCKPLYIGYLLSIGYERVIYVDNDICFFSSADFLFEKLNTSSILLTPHHYSINPARDQNWLEANFRVGLYNAGFIGVQSNATLALDWWASCCLYNVKKSAWRGLFDDQKYLDLFPVAFEGVEIMKHKGCNVAGWNVELCPRSIDDDGKVRIDNKWPVVFIHFTPLTFENILRGNDELLKDYFDSYLRQLCEQNNMYSVRTELKKKFKDYLLYFRHIIWQITRLSE